MTRTLKATLIAVAIATGAYWYGSPYLAIHQMKSAADKGDADTFNEHVDYPRLRESLKGQLTALMTDKLAAKKSSGDGIEAAGAALGSMLGLALVDRFVDALVRPEVVMRAMEEGRMKPVPGASRPADTDAKPSNQRDKVEWTFERKGLDKLLAHGARPSEPVDQRVSFVFERSGFATWKLTEIRLPLNQ